MYMFNDSSLIFLQGRPHGGEVPGEHADHVLAEQGHRPEGGVPHAGRQRRRDQLEGQLHVEGKTKAKE